MGIFRIRTNALTTLIIAVVLGIVGSPAWAADLPNVILIMTDDLGYGDVGCYGATAVRTPNIDRLARGGLRFTSGYAAAATCTPTRYAMLTGQYAWRQPGTGIAPPNATALIQPGTVTLASIMKQAGYATGVVGKWHLGLGAKPQPQWNGAIKPGPLEIGFDYCFLMPTTGDRVPCVYVENHHVVDLEPDNPITVTRKNPDGQPTGKTHRHTLKMDWSHGHNASIVNGISRIGFMTGGHEARWRDEDMADVFTARAVKYIEDHAAKPFFLFFSTHDIHVPRMPHERFQGKTALGYRGDAIEQMDWCVGQLLKTLDRLNLTNNTLIIFCSDNGPVLDDGYKDGAITKLGDHKAAGPYRGGKYSIYEGGTRTPLITHWPARIKPGVSDEMVCVVDLPGSLAALTRQDLPAAACRDSFNVLGALLGKAGARGRDHLVEQGRGLALRVGDWKLLKHPNAKSVKSLTYEKGPGQFELYNLADDPAETTNLIAQHPDRAAQMKRRLQAIQAAGRSRPFEPTVASLRGYQCPEWFRNAKFGIYLHWGAYSVAQQGEWYARKLYDETTPEYKHHLEHYGHPSQHGYKDFIPQWKAENFDPDALLALFKRSGAKYFTPCAVHHDNFDLWNSKHHEWNAVKKGPQKDLIGMWREATLKAGLRFGVTTHLSRSYSWLNVANQADSQGPQKGVPYDGAQGKAKGLYPPNDGQSTHPRAPFDPPKSWRKHWARRVKQLIDDYQPDHLYFDCAVPFRGEDQGQTGLSVVTHFLNQRPEGVMCVKERPWQGLYAEGITTLDYERGKASHILDKPWQTDDSIGSWGYNENTPYTTADAVVDKIIDIVSKNGNMLLNIPIRADGTLDETATGILEDLGRWFAVNGEGIYATRPWYMHGEGKTEMPHKTIESPFTFKDIRYTTKDEHLYAFVLKWPGKRHVEMQFLAPGNECIGKIKSVSLLGHKGKLKWEHHPDGLRVWFPKERPCDFAYGLKIHLPKK